MKKIVAAVLSGLIFAILIPGMCSSDSSDRETRIDLQNRLRTRAEEYLMNRKTANFALLYDMHSAKFRSRVSKDDFESEPLFSTVLLMAYYIEGVRVENGMGTVYSLEMEAPSVVPVQRLYRRLKHAWVYENGEWFIDPEISPRVSTLPVICGNTISPVRPLHGSDTTPAPSGQ